MDDNVPEGLKMTEIGLIPSEWDINKLGDLVRTYTGGTPRRDIQEYWYGHIPWLKSGELNDSRVLSAGEHITEEGLKNSSAKFVEEGTLLIAMYGATAGKVGLARSRFTINQAICAIVPNDIFHAEFYFYYMQKIRQKLLAERYGGAQPNLSQQIIKSIGVPLPPLLEQKKIAIVLSAVQEAKEKTEGVVEATRGLKKSLMKHLFIYGPVSPEDADKVPLKETEIGLVPEEWEVANVDECLEAIIDYRGKTPRKTQTGVPLLTAKVVKGGRIKYDDCEFIDEAEYDVWMRRGLPQKGDVLLTTEGPLGEVAQLDGRKVALAQRIIAIRGRSGMLDNTFLMYCLMSTKGQQQLNSRATGTTVLGIKQKVFRRVQILLPPLPTQRHIADILSAVDRRIEAEENRKQALEELFRTLLNNLMTGRIRVNNLGIEPTGR